MVLTEAQLQEIAKRVRAIIRAESKGVGESTGGHLVGRASLASGLAL